MVHSSHKQYNSYHILHTNNTFKAHSKQNYNITDYAVFTKAIDVLTHSIHKQYMSSSSWLILHITSYVNVLLKEFLQIKLVAGDLVI